MISRETCYGYDAFRRQVLRFSTKYQRGLWLAQCPPDYPSDRQELAESHHLVRRVKAWSPDPRGVEVGHP